MWIRYGILMLVTILWLYSIILFCTFCATDATAVQKGIGCWFELFIGGLLIISFARLRCMR